MATADAQIRIGKINYTNVWPIYHFFPHERFEGRLEWIETVPTGLNKAMKAGQIDMGAISSFAYGESYQDYEMYPDLSVSAVDKVNSILLFHRRPLEELDGARLALPTTSATSVNLLKVLLEKFYGVKPQYEYATPSLKEMMETNEAALLIGDDAIRASWTEHPYLVTDLGELWRRCTGTGMTFAVWAVRKQTIREFPELIADIHQAFLESKRHGVRDPESIIRQAMQTVGGEADYWRHYFRHLNHDFGEAQQQGLRLYFRYARELGLLAHDVPLQFWTDISRVR
ncbi:menaquinone biosynthetic enzyme MqnA/MqnD family protein [Paenibacillus koleovorans]|uniref:menaquinone biosynthetic enzyme MqnA/MqnD family protein n=1 Tax=Paenibacillus koleovorans TaxID=121608 RepID=UPI000FD746B7|nr:menaquinone biosynthesis protein [Paenibacillus koleovorans]